MLLALAGGSSLVDAAARVRVAVVEAATGRRPRGTAVLLQVSCYDDEQEEDVDVPTIAYSIGAGAASVSRRD